MGLTIVASGTSWHQGKGLGKLERVLLTFDYQLSRDHAEDSVTDCRLGIEGIDLLLHRRHGFELVHDVRDTLEGLIFVTEH